MPDISSLAPGSWPQWLLLVVVALGFIKWLVPWRHDEMRKLRAELKECEIECDRRIGMVETRVTEEQELRKKLEADLWGEKRSRVAEQISFINIILQSVDAPELKTMLKSLESVQAQIRVQHILEAEVEASA